MDFDTAKLQAALGFKLSNGRQVITGDGNGELLVYADEKLTVLEPYSPSEDAEQSTWSVIP